MSELIVIHDQAQEFACIVNVDDRCGWGPAMIGPQAAMILQTWLDGMPFDPSVLTSETAVVAFESFLLTSGLAATPTPAEDYSDPVVAGGSPEMDEAKAADTEASLANYDHPVEQPADADMEADTSAPDTVIRCVNCNGAGTIEFGDGEPAQQCGMCKGTGKLTVGASA